MPTTQKGPQDFSDIINRAATKYGVDPLWIRRIINLESSGDPNALSRTGAQGLMQLMPKTFTQYGEGNPMDPKANIMAGAHYLSDILKHYKDPRDVLSMYNSGRPYSIAQRFPETYKYVKHFENTGGLHGPMYTFGVKGGARPTYSNSVNPWQMPEAPYPGAPRGTAPWEGPRMPPWDNPISDMGAMPQPQAGPVQMGPRMDMTPGVPQQPVQDANQPPPPFDYKPFLSQTEGLQTQLDKLPPPELLTDQAANQAHMAKLSAIKQNLPTVDPNDPRYNYHPYQAEAMPTRQQFAPAEQPAYRQDPAATLLGGIAGLISPTHAGAFAAAPIQASLAHRQQSWEDAIRKQQMNQQQADTSYGDQMSGFENRQRVGLLNFEGQRRAADALGTATDAERVRNAELAGDTAETVSKGFAIPGLIGSAQQRAGLTGQIKGTENQLLYGRDFNDKEYNRWEKKYGVDARTADAALKRQDVWDRMAQRQDWQANRDQMTRDFRMKMATLDRPLKPIEFMTAVQRMITAGVDPAIGFADVPRQWLPPGVVDASGNLNFNPGLSAAAATNQGIKQNQYDQGTQNIQLGGQRGVINNQTIAKNDQTIDMGTNKLMWADPGVAEMTNQLKTANGLRQHAQDAFDKAAAAGDIPLIIRVNRDKAVQDVQKLQFELRKRQAAWFAGRKKPNPGTPGGGANGRQTGNPPPAGGGKDLTYNPATGKMQ